MSNKKGFRHLNLEDRIKIDLMNRKGFSKRDIAREIGCCLRIIFYELQRSLYEHLKPSYEVEVRYNPYGSQRRYEENLKKKGKKALLKENSKYKKLIRRLILEERLSPENIIYFLNTYKDIYGFEKTLKSKTSLYNAVKKGYIDGVSMKELVMGIKEEKEKPFVIHKKPPSRSIDDRKEHINKRKEFGHWEMDCIVGKKEKGKTILVLSERLTRYQEIELLEEQTQEEVIKALDRIEERYGEHFQSVFKSITMDNGAEFLDYTRIERSALFEGEKRTETYYCHPGCPNERGSNENANKHLRRFFKKGSDFNEYVDFKLVEEVKYWINYIFHRRILKGECSGYVFEKICTMKGIEIPERYFDTS